MGDIYQKEGVALLRVLARDVFVSVRTVDGFYHNRLQVTAGAYDQWSPYWRTDLAVI